MEVRFVRSIVVCGLMAAFLSGSCERSHPPAAPIDAGGLEARAPAESTDRAHDARTHDAGPSAAPAIDAGDGDAETAADGGIQPPLPLSPVAAAELERCSIAHTHVEQVGSIELPTEFDKLPFYHYNLGCIEGGFDLTRCAGQTVEYTAVRTDESLRGAPDSRVHAHVLTLGDSICCTYRSVENTGGGVLPANCGPAYPARAAMRRCNIIEDPIEPARTVEEVSVPASLSAEPLWSERAKICRDGEYDLAACAGKQATLVTFNQNWSNGAGDDPAKAWVLSHGSELCCIWQTDGGKPPAMLSRKCELQR